MKAADYFEHTNNFDCLKILSESLTDAVALTTTSGAYLFKNSSFNQLFTPKQNAELSGVIANTNTYHSIVNQLQKGESWRDEIEIVVESNQTRKVQLKAIPFSDTEKKEQYFIWIFCATVINKKTEQQLELLKHGIDHAEIGIFQIDDFGNVVYANAYACRKLGYTEQEITAIQLFDIDPFIPKEQFLAFRKGTAQKESFTSEGRHRKKDGSTFPVEVTVNMKRLGEKGVTMSFVKDISAQKEAEAELNRKQHQLDNLMKLNLLGNWEYDFTENEFRVNDNFFSVFKTSVDQQGGEKMSKNEYLEKFVHPDDQIKVEDEFNKAIQTTDPNYSTKFEHKVIYSDGLTGFISVGFYIEKDEAGKTQKAYGVNQDISDRKTIEQDLTQAKEKAEESDRLKSAFLANMSHEIRTPMNGIMGFADLIKRRDLDGSQKNKYLDLIKHSGNRMLSLINDLIDISKIEAGQVEFTYRDVELKKLTTYLAEFFHPEAEKKNIQLKVNGRAYLTEDETIITDGDKLEQILINLIKNALKYTREGYVDFGYYIANEPDSSNEKMIYFYVEDTGIGIREDLKSKIFERFNQGETYQLKEIEGTGLGLAITKAYVELLGGEIWVETNETRGSVFNFSLPLKSVSIPSYKSVP